MLLKVFAKAAKNTFAKTWRIITGENPHLWMGVSWLVVVVDPDILEYSKSFPPIYTFGQLTPQRCIMNGYFIIISPVSDLVEITSPRFLPHSFLISCIFIFSYLYLYLHLNMYFHICICICIWICIFIFVFVYSRQTFSVYFLTQDLSHSKAHKTPQLLGFDGHFSWYLKETAP